MEKKYLFCCVKEATSNRINATDRFFITEEPLRAGDYAVVVYPNFKNGTRTALVLDTCYHTEETAPEWPIESVNRMIRKFGEKEDAKRIAEKALLENESKKLRREYAKNPHLSSMPSSICFLRELVLENAHIAAGEKWYLKNDLLREMLIYHGYAVPAEEADEAEYRSKETTDVAKYPSSDIWDAAIWKPTTLQPRDCFIDLPIIWGESNYGGYWCESFFGLCVLKGFEEDIKAAHTYMREFTNHVSYKPVLDEPGISELIIPGDYTPNDRKYISNAISRFPQLKFIGFYAENSGSDVFSVYSPSGYAGISERTRIGYIPKTDGDPWIFDDFPTVSFDRKLTDRCTDGYDTLQYKNPFAEDWEALTYRKLTDGQWLELSNEKEMKERVSRETGIAVKNCKSIFDYRSGRVEDDTNISCINAQKDTEKRKYLFFKRVEKEGVIIQKYKGTQKDVVIPDVINGDAVLEIDGMTFRNRDDIESVWLPDTLLRIGSKAFVNCPNLRYIALPKLSFLPIPIWKDVIKQCPQAVFLAFDDATETKVKKAGLNCMRLTKRELPEGFSFQEHYFVNPFADILKNIIP